MGKKETKDSGLKGTVDVVKVFPVENKKTSVVANCTICIAECMWVNNILLIESKKNDDGYFISLPSQEYKGKYNNFVIFDKPTTEYITKKIIKAYEKTKDDEED